MSVLWKKIEFYKGKGNFELIVIVVWGFGHSPGRFSRGKPKNCQAF